MVEQTRELRRAISLQAGPSEVENITLADVNFRFNTRAARAIGRQLAEIGDQLEREWTERLPNQWPPTVHIARPAYIFTRDLYRGIQRQLWDVRSCSAVMKAWFAATVHSQGTLRAEAWAAWVSSIQPSNYTGWTTGIMATVALVGTATIGTVFWEEWKG